MPYKKFSLSLALMTAGLLVGCSDDDETRSFTTDSAAIISTVAPDFSGSDIQLVDLATGDFDVSSGISPKDQSDYIVTGGNEAFYHIGKYNIDEISRYSIEDTASAEYTYKTLEDSESSTSNPYTMVEFSDNKAFLIRYNADKIWVVNPMAETQAEFKIGEIDLSHYDDGDGSPNAFSGKIINNQLFVGMQRLVGFDSTDPDTHAYIAVFNADTLVEIDTNDSDDTVNLKGIKLLTRNPYGFSYHKDTGLLVASGDDFYASPKVSFNSGIEKINVATYENTILIDDGTDQTPVFGGITNVSIVDADNAFFVDYGSGGYTRISSLYHFNPTTGDVSGKVSSFNDLDISALTTDTSGQTWVGISDAADPRIHIINSDQSEVAEISLIQNPNAIAFVTKTMTQ